MNRDEIEQEVAFNHHQDSIREWERKAVTALLGLLITVFGIWAGVVWNGTKEVVTQINDISKQLSADRLEQVQYRMLMERRLTIQEQQLEVMRQRQQWVIEHIQSEGKGGLP